MAYNSFEDWYNEIEITGMRSDRFYDEFLSHQPNDHLLEWLKAAYNAGREYQEAEIERLKEYEWMYKDLCE